MENEIKAYLQELQHKYDSGETTEQSFYPTLQRLLESLASQLNVTVEVIPIPKRTEVGVPDFALYGEKHARIGNVEAKPIGSDLSSVSQSDQLRRYREYSENLILTNYLEFWLYRHGKRVKTISLMEPDEFLHRKRFRIVNLSDIETFFSTFFSHAVPSIYKAEPLASELARRTRLLDINIRENLDLEIKEQKGKLYELLRAFQEHLISDLQPEAFADMYAQTIAYGLLLAKINADAKLDRRIAHLNIPHTISLLYDMFHYLAEEELPRSLAGVVDDITSLLNYADISSVIGDLHRFTSSRDPVIHFYETFLAEYDPRLRKTRGIYYTPEPVVSFIVRSVHQLLKDKFGLPAGLADKRVKILDPACGTGTFLAEVIRTICEETIASGKKGILKEVIKEHILEDVYGFELLMAPYAMAHLKLSLLLEECGRPLQQGERLKIYLTNALEKRLVEPSYRLFEEALTRESRAAYEVKEETPILVVLGNPPYSVSSYNKSPFIEDLMDDYKEDVRGERNIQPLSDDYIKFIRFAHWKIDHGRNGIFSYISNNSYFSGLIHRGMRRKLTESFDEIYLLNLHGSTRIGETCSDGSKDENIFDIQQGNGIGIFVKLPKKAEKKEVKYFDLHGLRKVKTKTLLEKDVNSIKWEKLQPKDDLFFFIQRDLIKESEYNSFIKSNILFPVYKSGVQTGHDHFAVAYSRHEIEKRINIYADQNINLEYIKETFNLKNHSGWNFRSCRNKILDEKIDKKLFVKYSYKPFDLRHIYFCKSTLKRPVKEIMKNFFCDNLGLILMRKPLTLHWDQVLLTKYIIDINFYKYQTYIFPLYIYKGKKQDELYKDKPGREANFNPEIMKALTDAYNHQPTPEQVLFYCYGVFHSETYRRDYEEFLRIDFPRVPFTGDYKLFLQIAEVGERLGKLHLMESPLLDRAEAEFPVQGDHRVEKPLYDPDKQRLYINKTEYFGKVPGEVWEFVVGGYQVLRSYLRYRRGRNLSGDEIEHLLKVITAIKHTLKLMPQADRLFRRIDLGRLVALNPC